MKKVMSTAMAVVLAAGALATTTVSADARPGYRSQGQRYVGRAYRGRYHGGYGNRAAGAAVAGVAGALIGGAIIASQRPRYDYYYGPGYGAYGAYSPYGTGYGYPGYGYPY